MSDSKPTRDLLECIARLVSAETRAAAAREIAEHSGAVDLIFFVHDEGVGRSLPAPGFPQTLRGGAAWINLLKDAVEHERGSGTVLAASGEEQLALALGSRDGTAAVFLGGAPVPEEVEPLRILLPLIGGLLRMEAVAVRAETESRLARQSAQQASALASKLDVTRADLQRALAIAETASRARDEFLATVSHELRTPLTSVLGWIQLLQGETDAALLAEGLETLERNARAQTRLIEDLLDFSRINAGKLRLDVKAIEPIDVVSASLDVIRPAAEGKGVRIESVLDPNVGLISGDADRLQQVIWNLLSNAVKFTPRGGKVQVRLQRVNSHCEISVSDTGEGIPHEFLPFVFDRFSQADSTSTRMHSGLGLGLGIVRHLVEMHGGSALAFSPGAGRGATFVVRLPLIVAHREEVEILARGAEASCEEAPPPAAMVDLTGVSVLILEDNDDARRLLTRILKKCGAAVVGADSVPDALARLSSLRPDIIISDIEMPGEDGYSFVRKLRLQESPAKQVPVIALTAYTRSVDRSRALAAGFQMHLGKPVEPAELAAAVKNLVATSRQEGSL